MPKQIHGEMNWWDHIEGEIVIKALTCLTALVGTLSISALSQPTRKSLDHLHQRYAKLLVAKDFSAIERFYDEHISRDFKWKKAHSPLMTFSDMWEGNRLDMANLASGKSDGPIMFRVAIKKWNLKGNVATLEVQTNGNGEWYKDGKWIPVTFQMLVREEWRYESGRWIAISFEDISVNGKFGKPQNQSSWRSSG